jgi:hypothetical protein
VTPAWLLSVADGNAAPAEAAEAKGTDPITRIPLAGR